MAEKCRFVLGLIKQLDCPEKKKSLSSFTYLNMDDGNKDSLVNRF